MQLDTPPTLKPCCTWLPGAPLPSPPTAPCSCFLPSCLAILLVSFAGSFFSLQHLNLRGSQGQVLRLFLGNFHQDYLFQLHLMPLNCLPPGQASPLNSRPINLTDPLTSLLGYLKGSQTLHGETELLTCLLPNLDPDESLISENGSSILVVAEAKTLEVILDHPLSGPFPTPIGSPLPSTCNQILPTLPHLHCYILD